MLLLYLLVLISSLLVISFTPISSLFYLVLFLIALYACKKAAMEQGVLLLSESGLIELLAENKKGKIGPHSFYNGFFIFLQVELTPPTFTAKTSNQFMLIYKDAITDEQYRLLARLINSGRS